MAITAEEEYDIVERYIRTHSKKVRRIANGISYCCLYHGDDRPSASHVLKNGKVMDFCSVCGSIHQQLKKDAGAWEERPSKQAYSKFETFLYYNQQQEYKYHDFQTGKYLYSCFRLKDKSKGFPVGVRDGKHVTSGTNGIDTSLAVFTDDIKKLKEAIKGGALVAYTEGEKDCIAVIKNGQICFTCGGTKKFKEALLPYLKDGKFIVFADNDEPGIEDAGHITALLNTVGTARMVVPMPDVPKADISDYFQAGHSRQEFEQMIQQEQSAVKETMPSTSVPAPQTRQDEDMDYAPFHFYNDKGLAIGINHNAIAEDIKAKHSLFVSGIFYESDRGHFKPDTTGAKIKGYIKRRILSNMRKSQPINQIYNLLHDDFSIERDFKDTNLYPARWVPFNDCLFDPLTFEEIAYDDKYFCTNRLPHNWKDCKNAAEGEEIEKFLHFAIPDEQDREMALGFDGLSCNRDTSFQKALLEVGQGGSGKSIKIRLLQAMLGADNYSNISLFDLGKRFMPGLLLGKLANICSDLPLVALKDEASEALKLIVGEDVIFHESKGQNGFFFTPYCKMTFSTNLLPQVLDERNNAVFRRLLILRMDNTPEHPDVNLFSKLNKELPYYIKLCMDALHRVYERGKIFESENSKSEIDQMRRDSDTTEDFLDVCCVKESGARIDRGELFAKYERHCENEGRQSLSKNAFNKAIRAKGYKQVKSCGYWFFEGISLKKYSLNLPTESRETSLNGVEADADGFMRVDEEALKELPFT